MTTSSRRIYYGRLSTPEIPNRSIYPESFNNFTITCILSATALCTYLESHSLTVVIDENFSGSSCALGANLGDAAGSNCHSPLDTLRFRSESQALNDYSSLVSGAWMSILSVKCLISIHFSTCVKTPPVSRAPKSRTDPPIVGEQR